MLPLSISLRSSSSCLCILPHLPIISILPSTFTSITRFRRQFLCKVWPIQLAFLLFIVSGIFLSSLTQSNTSSFLIRSVKLIFSILLQHHISKLCRYFLSTFYHAKLCSQWTTLLVSSLNLSLIFWWRVFFPFMNFAFDVAFLDLISCAHLSSYVNMLPTYLKYSTFSTCFSSVRVHRGDGCLKILP